MCNMWADHATRVAVACQESSDIVVRADGMQLFVQELSLYEGMQQVCRSCAGDAATAQPQAASSVITRVPTSAPGVIGYASL
jgi:hypothetical protein